MTIRTQITLDPETQRRAQAKAAELGISFDEYLRRLVEGDVGRTISTGADEVSALFDLVDEGPATDIALEKDRMVEEAVKGEHHAETAGRRAGARGPT